MPAPKGNSNAAKGGIDKTLRIRFADEEALQIALNMSPATRGALMVDWGNLRDMLADAYYALEVYVPDRKEGCDLDVLLANIERALSQ